MRLALSIEQHAPICRIVYDKFHVLQHANAAVDEVRRAEFFRKGGRQRGLIKGKRWLLLTRWWNLTGAKRKDLNTLFAMNRKLLKAYLLKESLARLWFIITDNLVICKREHYGAGGSEYEGTLGVGRGSRVDVVIRRAQVAARGDW